MPTKLARYRRPLSLIVYGGTCWIFGHYSTPRKPNQVEAKHMAQPNYTTDHPFPIFSTLVSPNPSYRATPKHKTAYAKIVFIWYGAVSRIVGYEYSPLLCIGLPVRRLDVYVRMWKLTLLNWSELPYKVFWLILIYNPIHPSWADMERTRKKEEEKGPKLDWPMSFLLCFTHSLSLWPSPWKNICFSSNEENYGYKITPCPFRAVWCS